MKTPTLTGRLNRNHPVFSRFRYLGVIWLALIAVARAVVDTPTASPNGTYATFLSVNVSCTTQSAKIYYTVNGGPPTTADHLYGTNNTFEGIQNSPVTLTFKAFLQGVPDGSDVTTRTYTFTGQVSTSGNHTLVLLANGTVWAAGKNDYGQLGDGTTISQIFLKQVPNLSNVVAVAAGGNHSLALLKDGTVKAWGLNTNWQCGASGGTTPQLVPNSSNPLTNVTRIAAGATHSVALTSAFNGTVYTWGGGANGQQGNGTYTPNGQYGQGANVDRATPGLLSPSLTGIKDIASGGGGNHTLALTNAGSVYCWGSNAYAQCGNGSPAPLHRAAMELLLPEQPERLVREAQSVLKNRTVPEKQHALALLAQAAAPAADGVLAAEADALLAGKCEAALKLDVIEALRARSTANPALAAKLKNYSTSAGALK